MLTTLFVAALMLSVTGCGELDAIGVDSGGSSNFSSSVEVDNKIQDLDQGVSEVDLALADVDDELKVVDIAYLISGPSSSGSQKLTDIDDKLKRILQKLHYGVLKAYGKVNDLYVLVDERIAKLDPLNPLHVLAIEKLNQAREHVDRVKQKLDGIVARLSQKLAELVVNVDRKVSQLNTGNPLTLIAAYAWGILKPVLNDYRQIFANLAGV